jgi:hypothetical protein
MKKEEIMANTSLYLWILELAYYHMVRSGPRGGKWSDRTNANISVSNILNGGAYTSVKQKGKKKLIRTFNQSKKKNKKIM